MRLVLSLASSAVTPYFAIRNYLEFALPEADISCVVFNDSEGNVRLPRRLVSHVQEERTWLTSLLGSLTLPSKEAC